MTKKSKLPIKTQNMKLVRWENAVPKSVISLSRKSRAGVVMDKDGAPQLFIFDTAALLDILSEIDERLVDRLPAKEYHAKSVNPAGWLIDEIESRLPLNSRYIESLREAIHEAEKKGWIPFENIERELRLV